MANAFKDIITRLEKQKIAIDRALGALREVGEDPEEARSTTPARAKKVKGKRIVSPEARERMAEAQRKRWAATKKSAAAKPAKKQAAKKTAQ